MKALVFQLLESTSSFTKFSVFKLARYVYPCTMVITMVPVCQSLFAFTLFGDDPPHAAVVLGRDAQLAL